MLWRPVRSVMFTMIAIVVALATGGAVMAFSSGPVFDGPIVPTPNSGDQTTVLEVSPDGVYSASALPPDECLTSYANGSGLNELEWCHNSHGSLIEMSLGGLEHVQVGTVLEGWCVSAAGSIRGRVRGQTGAGQATVGLAEPSYPHPTKVRHNTLDGDLRIESRFSTSPGNDQIIVKMNVRNLSGGALNNVNLTRFVDADIALDAAGTEWTSSSQTVTAYIPGSGMLQIFPKSDDLYPALSMIGDNYEMINNLDESCYNAGYDATLSSTASDRSMGVMYSLGTIFPGDTKTVQFIYGLSV